MSSMKQGSLGLVLALALGGCGGPPLDGARARAAAVDVTCDADDDGYAATACGGDDCDDTDPAINPGAGDVCCDGIDQDCDGTPDNGLVASVPQPNAAPPPYPICVGVSCLEQPQ